MSKNLNEAAMAGNLEEVLLRLNLGEDVNQMLFPRYSTPLHDATTCGRIQIAKMLIEKGAKDEQDPPSRKQSIGPDPPWMVSSRKSSAVTPSRREGLSIGAN